MYLVSLDPADPYPKFVKTRSALSLSLSLRSGKENKRLEEEGIWQGSESRIQKQEEILLW